MNYILFFLILPIKIYSQDLHWPTDSGTDYSSNFGEYRDDHFHMGIDIKTKGKTGFKIYAVDDGYISRIVSNFNGYGKALYLTTKSGNIALYAHLERFSPLLEKVWDLQKMKRGSYFVNANYSKTEFKVKKGDIIGYTGNSGYSYAPHLHFEFRDKNNIPLNPLKNGFAQEDNIAPILESINIRPISMGSSVNGSSLIYGLPLFRDKQGKYVFADTLTVIGDIGISIKSFDKREGANNKYQFSKAELFLDNKIIYRINYDKIPFQQGKNVKTLIEYSQKRQNVGEYKKLYRMPFHPKTSIHNSDSNGIIRISPGYHKIKIKIFDSENNISVCEGILIGSFPSEIDIKETSKDENSINLLLKSKRGGLPIKKATIYSFTPFGYPDENVEYKVINENENGFHISIPLRKYKNRIFQILSYNKINAMAAIAHWADYTPKITVLDIEPKIDISVTGNGVFIQIDLTQYVEGNASLKLSNNNKFRSYPLNKIQPTIFISELINPEDFININYIDITISNNGVSKEVRFNYNGKFINSNKKGVVFSFDKNCSIQTNKNSLYNNGIFWIERVKKFMPVKNGYHLSPVYQLEPFDIALKDSFLVGIRYNQEYTNYSKLGIYYFDQKENKWLYSNTKNNKKNRVLTTSLKELDAVTIIQDLIPPKIINSFPEDGGRYMSKDLSQISIYIDDNISGIKSSENSMSLKFNGSKILYAYQPKQKKIYHRFKKPLRKGNHKINIILRDKLNNIMKKEISFSVVD